MDWRKQALIDEDALLGYRFDDLGRPATLAIAASRHIAEAVIRGEFPPGASLRELSLASRLGVSRGTIREAVRLLADDGLVQIVPHRGATVTPLTQRTLDEAFGLRALLESYAVRYAAEHGQFTEQALARARRQLEELRRAAYEPRDPLWLVAAEIRFHETLTDQCDHELLKGVLASLRPQLRRLMLWSRAFDTADPAEHYQSHLRLLEAAASGSPEAIEAETRAHIEHAFGLLKDRAGP